jgi:hypothetical protein
MDGTGDAMLGPLKHHMAALPQIMAHFGVSDPSVRVRRRSGQNDEAPGMESRASVKLEVSER